MPPLAKPKTAPIGFADLLQALGFADDERVSLLALPDRRVWVVPPKDAPTVLADAGEDSNLFFGVNPVRDTATGRGTADDVTRLSCLWIDIDVKPGGCPTLDVARAIGAEVGLKIGARPAVTVSTGGGLHCYWPITSGGILNGDTAAASLLLRWKRLVGEVAARRDIKLDSVFDLPRMLRVPGSFNSKYGDPRLVTAEVYTEHEPLSLAAAARAMAAAGIPHIDVDTNPDEVSLPGEWQWAEQTCPYVAALSAGLSTDAPNGGRHPWLVSQLIRLVSAARLGCITHRDYQETQAALRDRFAEILTGPEWGEPREPAAGEFEDAVEHAVTRVVVKSDEETRSELGGHMHDADTAALFASSSSSAIAPTVQPPSSDPVQPVARLQSPNILEAVAADLRARGLVGEEKLAKTLYLVLTSRLLDKQVSAGVKGHSASGKSYTVELVVRMFPPDSHITFTGMSEKALIYSDAEYSHRTLVVYEVTALKESSEDDQTSYFIRTLLSEGRIEYPVTVKAADGTFTVQTVVKEGPTNMIFTTCKTQVHAENETRILSLGTDDSPAQTKRVLLALADEGTAAVEYAEWHQLQQWLEESGARTVTLPFGRQLAKLTPAKAVRMRRDFQSLLALIRSHALLHQLNRERDHLGRVVASLDDYEAVRNLVGDVISEGVEATASGTVRTTVAAVEELAAAARGGVTVNAVAKQLHIDKSSASRRLADAAGRDYVRNLETRVGQPGQWVVGEPLPAPEPIIPPRAELEAAMSVQPCNRPRPSDQGGCAVAPVAEEEKE